MTSPTNQTPNAPTRTRKSTAAKAAQRVAASAPAKPAEAKGTVAVPKVKEVVKAAPVKKAPAAWFDTASRPATANEQARYEWTLAQAGLKPADFPVALFLLGARNQKFYQDAHRS
jgi:hypothetical protein